MLPPYASDPARNPIRVLLIDHDVIDRDLFAHRFRTCAEPAELDCADSFEAASRKLEQASLPPDIIFIDLNLSEPPAAEFVRCVRSRSEFAHVLLIAMTGNLTYAAAAPSDYGADALLVKPITADDISALITLARAKRS